MQSKLNTCHCHSVTREHKLHGPHTIRNFAVFQYQTYKIRSNQINVTMNDQQ